MDASGIARQLVDSALQCGLLESADSTWAYNTVLAHVKNACVDDCESIDEDLAANLMGLIMPRPSEVADRFWRLHRDSPLAATEYFYRLSCDANYVRTKAIARNLSWDAATKWGTLRITINRTKPEKDPRDIAKLAKPVSQEKADYPACRLCMENEGYWGRSKNDCAGEYPPRGNLRIVPLQLAGNRWGLQYSPYAYYNEHCIAMNSAHVPMHIDESCFEALFDFVDVLPHYFIGSNADLPIVGGSILNHDHFQGGKYRFPMDEAPCVDEFDISGYPAVRASVLKWPVSVLNLRGRDRNELIGCACRILEAWRTYNDEEAGIVSCSDGAPHNTITPILRREGDEYVLNLALRCNITSEDYPLGVFHPHDELHHIKKENIGLIEVMGLAILPPRLKSELEAVADGLLSGADLYADAHTKGHAAWAYEIAARHDNLSESNIQSVLQSEVGEVFGQVLETAGVFKWDAAGRAALHRFIQTI